mgnify:CR=1 FL=1
MGKQYIAPMLVGNASVLYCNMDILSPTYMASLPSWNRSLGFSVAVMVSSKIPLSIRLLRNSTVFRPPALLMEDLVETGAFEPLDSYFTAEEADQYLYWDLGQIMGKALEELHRLQAAGVVDGGLALGVQEALAMCPITKDAKFYDDERFQSMYVDQAEIFHNWPAFANSDAFYDY